MRKPNLDRYIRELNARHAGAYSLADGFDHDAFYADGGPADRVPRSQRTRLYRWASVDGCDPAARASTADHYAGKAWRDFCGAIRHGGVEYVDPKSPILPDDPRHVADLVCLLPDRLRVSLDAVFHTLRADDPDGYYEAPFREIERRYYTAMEAASSMADSYPRKLRAEKRLALRQRRLWDMVPDFVEFFETLRYEVFDGGKSSEWRRGDQWRADEYQRFGPW